MTVGAPDDINNVAAIYNASEYLGFVKLLDKGPEFVAARLKGGNFYSCYIFPNRPMENFEKYLQDLSNSLLIHGKKHCS